MFPRLLRARSYFSGINSPGCPFKAFEGWGGGRRGLGFLVLFPWKWELLESGLHAFTLPDQNHLTVVRRVSRMPRAHPNSEKQSILLRAVSVSATRPGEIHWSLLGTLFLRGNTGERENLL